MEARKMTGAFLLGTGVMLTLLPANASRPLISIKVPPSRWYWLPLICLEGVWECCVAQACCWHW